MLKDLSKWKMCSLMVAFIFFFNTTGLAGLAIASNLPQIESSDTGSLLNQKIQEVSTSLKLIKNDISLGKDLTAHLDSLTQQYQEICQLNERISEELETVQTELVGLVEQGKLTSEFLERGDDFANHYHQNLAIILEDISEILNAPQVSVEQVDNVLNNIKELSPGVKANILGNKNDLKLPHRRSDIPRRGPTIESTRTMDILPTNGDVTASLDVRITPEIEGLAGELDYDITNIFSYVRNNVDYQPYYGSVKGSVGTYWEKAGNDFDQSSFLIALLRASDMPARYVAGVVGLPIGMAMNWVGVENAEAAIEVFSSNGIPSEAITSGSGKIIGLKFYHVWVEAYNEHGRWVGIDPSFKQYRYHDGIDIASATNLDVDAIYSGAIEGAIVGDDYISNLNETNLAADLDIYKNNLISYVEKNMPDATVGDVIGYREIIQKAKGLLPPLDNGGVFGISETKERFSEIPNSMRYLVNFQVPGINYSVAMPSIAEESTTISYVPATPYDENLIESYGGIFNVPAFLVHMKPLLKIDGEVVAEGSSSMLGSSQVLYSSFLGPEEENWSTNSRSLSVGAEYSIVLDKQKVSLDLIEKRTNRLEELTEDFQPEELATQAMIEETMYLTGLSYFARVNMQSDMAAKNLGVVWTRQPSQAIVAQEVVVTYFFSFPWKVSRGGRSIDVKRDIVNPISTTGNQKNELAWTASIGTAGSATEHALFENLYDAEAVSTIKILGLANRQGIPIYTVDSTNVDTVLPKLNTFSIVKDNIREAVEQGWMALCPQRNLTLNDWNGQGWLIVDPASGSAGYLLAGHLVSGNTIEVINGGSETTPSEPGNLAEFLVHIVEWMLHMEHFGIAAFFAGAAGYFLPELIALGTITLVLGGLALFSTALLIGFVTLFLMYQQGTLEFTRIRRRRYIAFA